MINLIVKPIHRIVEITDSYQTFDNLFFTDARDSSEFGRLNMALNNMLMRIESDKDTLRDTIQSLEDVNLELVRAHNDVVRAEKLASVGRLSAGFAHEIGNPIGIIQGYIELLKQENIAGEEKEQFGKRALDELDRIQQLIRQLLEYAGSSSQTITDVVVDQSLFGVVFDLAHMQKQERKTGIETDIEPDLAVKGKKEGLQQVFLNCILNAVDAIDAQKDEMFEGKIKISVKKEQLDPMGNHVVLISIEDNGVGIKKDQVGKLFDPFYTTKEPGKGTGLGLFVSHSIIEAHGGKMQLVNNQYQGVTVLITLPLYKPGRLDE